jgi:deoxyribose-phosphate aldolase
MNPSQLQRIDATILKPDALPAEVHKVAADAARLSLRAIVAAPVWIARLSAMLRGSGVRVVSAVSHPAGISKATIKAIEATSTIKDGADEIEVAAYLPHALSFDVDAARAELMEIVRAARSTRRDVFIAAAFEFDRVRGLDTERFERILETACRATRESGCDGVVLPAADIASAKKYGEALLLKATDTDEPAGALAAGADRAGVSRLDILNAD